MSSRSTFSGDVGQGVVGNQVQGDVGIAQGQIEIDQGDVVIRLLGQDAAEVDGDTGAADAAAGAEHGDDLRFDLGARRPMACRIAVGPARDCRSRCRASSSSSSTTGTVRNSLAPARSACRMAWPSPRALTARIGRSGNSALQLLNQLQGLALIGIQGDHDHVRQRLPDHVEEEFDTREHSASSQTDSTPSKQVAKRLTRGIGGIHNGDALYVLHEPPPPDKIRDRNC